MEELIKQGWWARQSPTVKFLIVTGSIALVVGGCYFTFRGSNDEEESTNKKSSSKSDDKNTATDHSETNNISDKKEIKAEQSSSSIQENHKIDSSLPNSGVGCSDVKTNFGRDIDFVKCNGVWYGKSKETPSNPIIRDQLPDWTSFESNKAVTERLNRRYP